MDATTWLGLYSSIYNAQINSFISLLQPEKVADIFKNAGTANSTIPIAIMHYQYDKLDDDALNKGLLAYSNGQLRNVAKEPSPYLKKELFAVAPQQSLFENRSLAFIFQSDLLFTNKAESIYRIEVKVENESNFITVPLNQMFRYAFMSGGTKTIIFRISYSDGKTYVSRSRIFIDETSSLRATTASLIDDKHTIKASSSHSGGVVEIHYSEKNTTGKLQKPLIIAEPFDMHKVLTIMPDYNLDNILNMVELVKNMLDSAAYDVVYVNFNDGLDDIFRNVKVFQEA
ncbi:hypothetical protein FACS189413_17860 [Bacteroidia bacterium]|nr:hypothetical protein FACS189413_17860 [Bacteroidia bacterium]